MDYRKRYVTKTTLLFFLLFTVFLFLRMYELPERALAGWDQADSAWAAKKILTEHFFTLQGVPIKGNADMFLGPLYYYLITPFYFLTKLDMIASPIFASVVSIISFFVFYHITKRLFNTHIALVAGFIYTFSIAVMISDRVQAAFILIPILSYVVFYCLYKILLGHEKYILYLAVAVGFGFHIHFTTIFYLLILPLTLFFFPRTKKMFWYCMLALPVFLLFLAPILYPLLFTTKTGENGIIEYVQISYHGFHLTRFFQLTHDGFISFQKIIDFSYIGPLAFLLFPLFLFIFNIKESVNAKIRKERLFFSYLLALWILIPWLVFSTYNGELTDYYFSLPRNIAIATMAFLLVYLYKKKSLLLKMFVIFVLTFYAGTGLNYFFNRSPGNYLRIKQQAELLVEQNKKLPFKDRDALYYMYEIYRTRK